MKIEHTTHREERCVVQKPADEQPNSGINKSIVVHVLVEFGLTATLSSNQDEQLNDQIDAEEC